jgi:hypothetical protein
MYRGRALLTKAGVGASGGKQRVDEAVGADDGLEGVAHGLDVGVLQPPQNCDLAQGPQRFRVVLAQLVLGNALDVHEFLRDVVERLDDGAIDARPQY